MSETKDHNGTQVVLSVVTGFLAFLIAGILAAVIGLRLDNYILATVIAGITGGLLLGLFHWKEGLTARMAGGGLAGVLLGFWGGFVIAEAVAGGISFLLPARAISSGNWWIADLLADVLMGFIFGAVFGAIVLGRRAARFFALVCGAVALPFGLLVTVLNRYPGVREGMTDLFAVIGITDMNLVVMIAQFGAGAGLALGLYHRMKRSDPDISLQRSIF